MTQHKQLDNETEAHYRLECLKLAAEFVHDGGIAVNAEGLVEIAECFSDFVWPKD